MKRIRRFFPVLVFIVLPVLPAPAQTPPGRTQVVASDILPNVRPPSSESPLWVQDLRRGEIVAFGSFPFTMFASTFTMDSVRFFKNDMNRAYLPWPLKGPGAIEMSRQEKERTLLIAAAASITIAVIDFAIVKVKRSREARREQARDRGGDIHVIRVPAGDAAPGEEPGTGDTAGDS